MKLETILNETMESLREARTGLDFRPRLKEAGRLVSVGRGVASVSGLPRVKSEELVRFPGGISGLVFNVDPEEIGVILLGRHEHLEAGMRVERTHRVVDSPVGEGLLGRVIDVSGRPLDDRGRVPERERRRVEIEAPAIMDRAAVAVPLQTGIKSIDALIPIGRGQRELILGDRQTGKTAIAVDAIINQRETGVLCIYCAVGQRDSAVARVVDDLRRNNAMDHTIVVVASGEDPPGVQFIAPYAAMTVGEYFMEKGRDVLIVFDDLTKHARSYRELSLLLRRPPGREAYPGDIFYIHSRLLERSTHLRNELGGGSITALPVIETQAQNISAYIPTNLISITDGQIYLSPELFRKGHLPAIDVGKSVSRVGGKAQLPAYRAVTGDLRLSYSQFEELERFARFGTRLDEDTRSTLEHGYRVREVLKQPQHRPIPVPEQIVVLLAASEGVFDDIDVAEIAAAADRLRRKFREEHGRIAERIRKGEKLGDEDRQTLVGAAREIIGAKGG